jgi:hypothetical protein
MQLANIIVNITVTVKADDILYQMLDHIYN